MRLYRDRGRGRHVAAVLALVFGIVSGAAVGRGEEPLPPRLSALTARTRGPALELELVLTASAPFSFFTLDDPRRLVIDYVTSDGRGPETPPVLPGPLGEPRFGLFTEDRGRVVLPLLRPFRVMRAEASERREDMRIRLALEPVSADAYAAAAGWPEGARWDKPAVPFPPRRPGDGRIVVMIDPGHGGNDPGAVIDGLTEKEVVLEFARRLAERLNRSDRLVARLTRTTDVFLPLGARGRAAQRAGAHLFLSIHADTVTWGEASGVSVYTLAPEASDEATAALAERENRVDILSGAAVEGTPDDLAMVLIDLAQRGTIDESRRLARTTLAALDPLVELLRTRPHRQADFRVLKAPEIPSLLIELGFLTSTADRARILSPAWQENASAGIEQGILDWAGQASAGYLPPGG